MISLIWNIQGAGSKDKVRTIKEMVRLHKPHILGLLEPKISGSKANEVCKQLGFEDWVRVEALGFSGGIWVLWRNTIKVKILKTHTQFILLQVTEGTQQPWCLAVVYGSPAHDLRKRLWSDLRKENLNFDGPWLAAGDFNAVSSANEVSNLANFSQRRCGGFNEWIFDQSLIDISFEGPILTWKRGTQQATFRGARLDRALGDIDWRVRFQKAGVKHLPMISSDHSPLLISTDGYKTDKRVPRFSFQVAWFTNKDLEEVVRNNWNRNLALTDNIHNLVPELKSWNDKVFGCIAKKKNRLMARIAGVQKKLLNDKHEGLFKLDRKLQKELEEVLRQEELHWFQKSREEWIVSGDRNTRFYHTATIVRRSRRKVEGLTNDQGTLVTNKDEIKDMMMHYFTNLFRKDENCDVTMAPRGGFPILSQDVKNDILKDLNDVDIRNAVMEMAPLKAPGPDGFHAIFYQKLWNIVGKTVVDMAMGFFRTGRLPKGLNDTLITLIPKVDNPEKPANFRPISLCNVSYKIITKAMTIRLKKLMTEVVGPNQSSFVPNRQITDNILIYQETLNTMRRKRNGKGMMVLKIDLEKTYNRLSWDFIKDTLEEVGLGDDWTRNIMACVESSRLAILWEREQTQYFKAGRGIRKGAPCLLIFLFFAWNA